MGIMLKATVSRWLSAGLCLAVAACGPTTTKNGKAIDTPTTGQITVAVDEVAVPIIRSTVSTFEGVYTSAKIEAKTLPQEVGFQLLFQDSVRMVVGSRKLNDKERAVFAERNITPKEYEYALDAVAVIVHPSNPDTLLTLDRLRGVLGGETLTWPGRPNLKIVPVLDHGSSANAMFLEQKLGLIGKLTTSVYATGSTEKVLDYVAGNPGAIGFIGVGYVSDLDSPQQRAFRSNVRVASISSAQVAADSNSYPPYQAYLSLKKYPLARMLYIVSGEARSGLGTGFASWALSEKGQRIVLKAGLLPATMPVRLVQLNKTNNLVQ